MEDLQYFNVRTIFGYCTVAVPDLYLSRGHVKVLIRMILHLFQVLMLIMQTKVFD